MQTLNIAFYTFKRSMNNKNIVFKVIFFDILLILITGFSLKTSYETPNWETQQISVYSNDYDFKNFKSFINSSPIYKKYIKVKQVKSKAAGIEGSKGEENGECIEIKNGQVKSFYVYMTDLFTRSIAKDAVNDYKYNQSKAQNLKGSFTGEHSIDLKKETFDSFGFYSVTMLVMIILYDSKYGVNIIEEEYSSDFFRISCIPVNRNKIILGKIIGSTAVVFLQGIAIAIFAKILCKTNWNNNWLNNMLAIFVFAFFSINMGAFTKSVVKDKKVALNITNILIPVFTFIAGGYIPQQYLGDEIMRVAPLSPSYAVQNIIFNNIYGFKANEQLYYSELLIISFVLLLGTMIFKRRQA
ncbi:MAG: ABC transporter permease [Clostridium sp.]|nr:ABC transporter permease [Clostridium sp.]